MQIHIRKYGPILAVMTLFIIGSYAVAHAGDPAFAKTVFYVN